MSNDANGMVVSIVAFKSIREALKFTALLRTYNGQGSAGGEALYEPPIMIKCYPSVENKYITNSTGASILSKTVLYVSADVPVKEQDLIILESASPNWFGKEFKDNTERNDYYAYNPTRLVENKTWCCVNGKAEYWNGSEWSDAFDGIKLDGEIVGGFKGKAENVKSVPKYFDGFGWEDDAEHDEGLSIQEIGL